MFKAANSFTAILGVTNGVTNKLLLAAAAVLGHQVVDMENELRGGPLVSHLVHHLAHVARQFKRCKDTARSDTTLGVDWPTDEVLVEQYVSRPHVHLHGHTKDPQGEASSDSSVPQLLVDDPFEALGDVQEHLGEVLPSSLPHLGENLGSPH